MFEGPPTPASAPVPLGRETQSVGGVPPVSSRLSSCAKSSGSSSLNDGSLEMNVTIAPLALSEGLVPLPAVPAAPDAREALTVVPAATLRTGIAVPLKWVTDPSPRLSAWDANATRPPVPSIDGKDEGRSPRAPA